MRYLFIILTSITISSQAKAMCAWSGFWAFPKAKTIQSDSWIILEGYAHTQSVIDSLNIGYPVYLEADGVKISLTIKHRFKGQKSLTQAILIPDEKLIVGKTYFLKIDSLKGENRGILTRWNQELEKREPIAWTVNEHTDYTAPKLLAAPVLVDITSIRYGCGPSVHAVFELPVEEETELFVRTELVDLKSGESTTYLLAYNASDSLRIGHGMCSGAFTFNTKRDYKIRFSLVDINGNENEQWTEWIEFRSPLDNRKARFDK